MAGFDQKEYDLFVPDSEILGKIPLVWYASWDATKKKNTVRSRVFLPVVGTEHLEQNGFSLIWSLPKMLVWGKDCFYFLQVRLAFRADHSL